jgi:hypothetical protein
VIVHFFAFAAHLSVLGVGIASMSSGTYALVRESTKGNDERALLGAQKKRNYSTSPGSGILSVISIWEWKGRS